MTIRINKMSENLLWIWCELSMPLISCMQSPAKKGCSRLHSLSAFRSRIISTFLYNVLLMFLRRSSLKGQTARGRMMQRDKRDRAQWTAEKGICLLNKQLKLQKYLHTCQHFFKWETFFLCAIHYSYGESGLCVQVEGSYYILLTGCN